MSKDDAIKRLEALGKKGLVVSIAYGPYSGTKQYSGVPEAEPFDLLYSVDLLWPNGQFFRKPYACKTFEEAVAILEEQVAPGESEAEDE